jgi:hypothetical protein
MKTTRGRIARPLVEHSLADDGELHWFAVDGVQYFISAHGHGHRDGYELRGDHATQFKLNPVRVGVHSPHFQPSADGLVRFHVEALHSVRAVDLSEEARVECDHYGGRYEYSCAQLCARDMSCAHLLDSASAVSTCRTA